MCHRASPGRLAATRPPTYFSRICAHKWKVGHRAQGTSITLVSPTAFTVPCTVTLSYYYYITVVLSMYCNVIVIGPVSHRLHMHTTTHTENKCVHGDSPFSHSPSLAASTCALQHSYSLLLPSFPVEPRSLSLLPRYSLVTPSLLSAVQVFARLFG